MSDEENGSKLGDDADDLSASDESEPEEKPSNTPYDPELDAGDDEDAAAAPAALPAALPAAPGVQSSFSLKGGGSGFSSRSHNIFDCLDAVAQAAAASFGQDNVIDGVFARPLPPAPARKTSQPPPCGATPVKKRSVPDYLVHPERWTHYSLEGVADTSDHSNNMAAAHFLAGLRQRKEGQQDPRGGDDDDRQKIVFSRPTRSATQQLPADKGAEKEMRLSHLEEDEDDTGGSAREVERKHGDKSGERGSGGVKGQPGAGEEEEEEGEKTREQSSAGFTSFRKAKKNYRKSSRQDDG